MDDIQDNSRMRRRIPTAHTIFGLPLTINACVQMYTQVINRVSQLGHPKVSFYSGIVVFMRLVADICRESLISGTYHT